MHMDGDWITLTEAARRLDRDRSGVFRRAKRGDFGEIREMGTDDGRPTLVLVSAAAIDAELERRAS